MSKDIKVKIWGTGWSILTYMLGMSHTTPFRAGVIGMVLYVIFVSVYDAELAE